VTCDTAKLSALADGDLSERQARRVRAHVAACASCTRTLADLEQMKRGLGALPTPVGDDNWSILVNRLAQPVPPSRRRFLSLVPWRWAAPTLAAVTLAAGLGGWFRWHKGRGLSADTVIAEAEAEFHKADAHYRRAVEDLRSVAEKQRRGWPVPKRAEYDAAQAQLEAAVTRCRQVAEQQPADVDAEELLFAAYRKEIRFFEDQMMREAQ
jgi:hypothetical protein